MAKELIGDQTDFVSTSTWAPLGQAVRAAVDAVDRVFRPAGGEAVFAGHPLQRCFRDIHTASQHILFSGRRDQAPAKVRPGIDQPTYLI